MVSVMLLGREMYRVEVTSRWEGFAWREGKSGQIVDLVELANLEGCVCTDLLHMWLDKYTSYNV